MKFKVIDGGLQKGHWQSDRSAYSEEDIAAWNAILAELAQSHHPAWEKWIWEVKERPALVRVK